MGKRLKFLNFNKVVHATRNGKIRITHQVINLKYYKSLVKKRHGWTGKGQHLRWASTNHVETMVISLWFRYLTDTRSLEKISSDSSSWYPPLLIKLDLDKFTKATAVITDKKKLVGEPTLTHNTNCNNHIKNASYLELLFRTVFAFPNASRTGFDCGRDAN